MAAVHVQIRMKKEPKKKDEPKNSLPAEPPPPTYDEALMIRDPIEASSTIATETSSDATKESSTGAPNAPERSATEREKELSIKTLQPELLRADTVVSRRKTSVQEAEENEPVGAEEEESDQTYSDDEYAFETYDGESAHDQLPVGSIDEIRLLEELGKSKCEENGLAASLEGKRADRADRSFPPNNSCGRIERQGERDADAGEVDAVRQHEHQRSAERRVSESAPTAVCYYDESTYTIISRLRAANKSLSVQLEKQTKVVTHLREEKKQHLQLIQTLRADLQLHKQTIKGCQSSRRRPNACDETLLTQTRSRASPALPHVMGVNDVQSGTNVARGNHPVKPPRNIDRLGIESGNGDREHSPAKGSGDLAKVSSPRVPSSPTSLYKRPVLYSPRSPGMLPATPHGALSNNSNALQQLLEKYAAKIEKAEQEKKETQIRHGHQLANYSHELSRLERQLDHAHKLAQEKENDLRLQKTRQLYDSPSSASGSSRIGASHFREHHPRGLLADDFWKHLAPPTTDGLHASATFSSHVGLAFEHLLSHQMVAFHDHSLDASTRDWLRELRVCGAQMLQLHRSFQTMSCTFQHLAESSHLYQLAETLAKESRDLLSAEQSLVFIVDIAEQEFWCRVPRSADAKEMVTVRSKLMPFATAGHTHRHTSSRSSQGEAARSAPTVETPSMHLSVGGLPSGLASMVYHTKRPLLLPAGHVTKHPCYSTASDNTDRMISHPSASTLLLPIIHRGHALGVIQLSGKTTIVEALGLSIALEKCDAFSHEDQALLMLLVHFASGLFPKVSYFTEVESNKVNEETLIQLAPEIFTCLRFEELGKIVIQNAKEILDADRCSLFVADNVERTLHNWQSDISGGSVQVYDNAKKSGMTIPFGHGIVGLVAETWQVVNISDAYEDPRFNSSWDKKTNYRTKSMLAVPILTNTTKRQPIRRASQFTEGTDEATDAFPGASASQNPSQEAGQTEQTLLGVVQVINKSGGAPFRAKDEFLLKTITKLIALAIENSQLFQKNQELCSNLGKLIANGDLVEAVISLGTSAEDIIGVESAAIYVYDHLAQEMVTFHRKRRHKIVVKEQMYRNSLFGDAMKSKDVVIVNDVAQMPHFNAYVDSIAGTSARNLLFAPLFAEDPDAIGIGGGTKLVGLLHLVNTKGRKVNFERHDLFLSIVTSMCGSVIASIVEKQTTLKQKDQTNLLLDTSMSFFKEMSPIGVINAVYNACSSIFSVEKAHLFLWEPDRRHMWTSKLLPHAEASTISSSSFHGSASPLGAAAGSGLSGGASSSAEGANPIPSLGSQLRRISVLTDQKLRVPTTEGLLEQVLVKGTVLLVKHWVEGSELDKEANDQRGFASSFRKYTLRINASDEKVGFTKHSVVACPVWDNYGLEIVGILVLLFPKGRAPPLSELTNLPILCRQISGALNVCRDLSAVSARTRKLQSMLEVSMRKPPLAMSLTLSSRGQLVTFSQPVNVVTDGFNAATLASRVHASAAINISVRSLPIDEYGNRWGFQLSGAGIHEMHTEHYVRWIGKDLDSSPLFDKLRTDLQSVYVRKEIVTGEVDREESSVELGNVQSISENANGQQPDEGSSANGRRDRNLSTLRSSLPKTVVFEIRKLLWEFVDSNWKVDITRACKMFDPVDPSRQRCVSRNHLEQTLSASGRSVQLDRLDWDLLHTQFADPDTDLVNVEHVFQSLAPQIHAVRHFAYEIIPILDPITQTVVNVHLILTAI